MSLLIAGWVAGAWAMDLDEARDRAVRQAITVEQAEADAQAARAEAWTTTAASLPAVVGFGRASTGAGFTAFGFERPVTTQYGIGAEGSWVLLSPEQWQAARAARRSASGQEAMVRWAMVDARREATAAYVRVLAAQAEARAWAQAQEDARAHEAAVRSQVEAGLVPAADLARISADRAEVEASLLEAEGRATVRCAELQGLLRMDEAAACALEPILWDPPLQGPGAHPALVAAEAAVDAARAERSAALWAMGPTGTVSGQAAWYATDEGPVGPGWSASAAVELPLTASGSGKAGLDAATAGERATELALEDQERALRVALISAEARLRSARSALNARQEALRAAEEGLRLVDERYRAGLAQVTDLLDSRRARDAAAVSLARSESELGEALAELEAARGVATP